MYNVHDLDLSVSIVVIMSTYIFNGCSKLWKIKLNQERFPSYGSVQESGNEISITQNQAFFNKRHFCKIIYVLPQSMWIFER